MSFVVHHSSHSDERVLLCCWRFFPLSLSLLFTLRIIGSNDGRDCKYVIRKYYFKVENLFVFFILLNIAWEFGKHSKLDFESWNIDKRRTDPMALVRSIKIEF